MTHIGNLLGGHRNPNQEKRDCPTHGAYTSFNWRSDRWTLCQGCVNDEMAERHRQESVRNTEDVRLQHRERLEQAKIPARFRDAKFQSFQAGTGPQVTAFKECKHYAEHWSDVRSTGRSLLLFGGVGTGKTHLAIAIASHVLNLGKSVLYVTFQEMMRAYKSAFDPKSGTTEDAEILKYATPELLILDEIGVQYGSDAEKDYAFAILNKRYNDMLPTIYISNLELERLREYLGPRLVDRIRESGGKALKFDWPSYRKAKP